MRSNKGFTLVEIMIVVAIIGILIAIAVPGFLRARETSRANSCQENMTKVDSAVQQYILEENLPDWTAALTELGGTTQDDWSAVLTGPDSYIRYEPACPSSGTYFLSETEDDAAGPVQCTIGGRHTYPLGRTT